MTEELRQALLGCDTDLDGALYRFGGDEELYLECLRAFMSDPTMGELRSAMARQSCDEVFTAAHALKGVAGNMGFVNLFHAAAELVILIRKGQINEVDAAYPELLHIYNRLLSVIGTYALR